jgi:hypothetical protein
MPVQPPDPKYADCRAAASCPDQASCQARKRVWGDWRYPTIPVMRWQVYMARHFINLQYKVCSTLLSCCDIARGWSALFGIKFLIHMLQNIFMAYFSHYFAGVACFSWFFLSCFFLSITAFEKGCSG